MVLLLLSMAGGGNSLRVLGLVEQTKCTSNIPLASSCMSISFHLLTETKGKFLWKHLLKLLTTQENTKSFHQNPYILKVRVNNIQSCFSGSTPAALRIHCPQCQNVTAQHQGQTVTLVIRRQLIPRVKATAQTAPWTPMIQVAETWNF